jgi:hypothetical protein
MVFRHSRLHRRGGNTESDTAIGGGHRHVHGGGDVSVLAPSTSSGQFDHQDGVATTESNRREGAQPSSPRSFNYSSPLALHAQPSRRLRYAFVEGENENRPASRSRSGSPSPSVSGLHGGIASSRPSHLPMKGEPFCDCHEKREEHKCVCGEEDTSMIFTSA